MPDRREALQTEEGARRAGRTVDAFLRRGPRIQITSDASPWGLGAVLTINEEIVSFLSSPITSTDRTVLALGAEAERIEALPLSGILEA